MANYTSNKSYTDKTKFENAVWYGLRKVLGAEFCSTGYFKPFWPQVLEGKFTHIVNGVSIVASMDKGVVIEQVEQSETDTPVAADETFGKFSEQNAGEFPTGSVRFYNIHTRGQLAYLEITALRDTTLQVGKEIARVHKIALSDIRVIKQWENLN